MITLDKFEIFKCQSCGFCCRRFICLYPSELQKARLYAQNFGIKIKFKPYRKFFDLKNQKIIVLIYLINHNPCPFLLDNKCLIYHDRFIVCRKYPISSWVELGKVFKFLGLKHEFYDIDFNCSFFQKFPSFKKILNFTPIQQILGTEYNAVLEDKKIWFDLQSQLNHLKKTEKIQIISKAKFQIEMSKNSELEMKKWEELPATQFFKKFTGVH